MLRMPTSFRTVVALALAACLAASARSFATGQGRLPTAPPADAPCAPVIVGNPDGNYITPGVLGGVTYRTVDGVPLRLDAFAPPGARDRPAIVLVHGGGYTSGSRVAHVGQLLEALSDAGFPWFSVDYRLGGPARRADAVEDVGGAIAFVRCNATRFGIDRDRLVLLGEDTGAEVALTLVHARAPGVLGAAVVGGRFEGATLAESAPGAQLLFVHGTDDDEQPISTIRSRCRPEVSAERCELVTVPGGIHRSENWRPSQWAYKDALVRWLDRMGPSPRSESELARLRPSARAWPMPTAGASSGSPAPSLAPGLHKRLTWDPERGLTLDAWVPATAGPHPLTVLVHGGGWEAGDRVTYISPLFEPLARADIAWVSIDYGLTPDVRHSAQLDDLRRAIRFVRERAGSLRGDPDHLVVVGESASGQMAAFVAADPDVRIAGLVSLYGVYDFEPMISDAGPRSLLARLFGRHVLDDESRRLARDASPIYRARTGMPRILLVHGTAEELWAQAVAYDARLTALGVPHRLLRLEGAPHGMENWEGHPEWAGYKDAVVEFIKNPAR
jgi:alpha-L-fucosidase 2